MMQPREDVMQKRERERESLSLCLKSSFLCSYFPGKWGGFGKTKMSIEKKKRVGEKHLDPAGQRTQLM